MKNYSKKLSWVVVLSLLFCIFFAFLLSSNAYAARGQVVIVPYATIAAGWWTGLSIRNDSKSEENTYLLTVYTDGGSYQDSIYFTLAPRQMRTDLLEEFAPSASGRVAVEIASQQNIPFELTVFMANTAAGGFGFNVFESRVGAVPDTGWPVQ